MKKTSCKRVIWLARQVRSRHKADVWEANVFKHARYADRAIRGGDGRVRVATSVFKVPENLLAERYNDRREIQDLLSSALTVLNAGGKVKLDFSRVRRCFPGGMLMLIAYLELLVEYHPRRVSAKCPPGSMAGQLLNHFGIGAKLGVSAISCQPRHGSVVNWHYVTGTKLDGTKISELLRKYEKLSDSESPEGLYDVLGEALTNVHHHAYPDTSDMPEQLRRWWMFSRFDPPGSGRPGGLYIAIYDIGEGIQKTMRNKLETGELILDMGVSLAELMGLNWKVLDRTLLEKAVEHERSSTGLANRGKGLPEMREFIEANDSGTLQILSGSSHYASNIKGQSRVASWPSAIFGTLILWSIPLHG